MKTDDDILDHIVRELKSTPPQLNASSLLTETILSKLPASMEKIGRWQRLFSLSLNAAAILLFAFFCMEQTAQKPNPSTRLHPTNVQYVNFDIGKPKQLAFIRKMQQNSAQNEAFQKTYNLFKANAL